MSFSDFTKQVTKMRVDIIEEITSYLTEEDIVFRTPPYVFFDDRDDQIISINKDGLMNLKNGPNSRHVRSLRFFDLLEVLYALEQHNREESNTYMEYKLFLATETDGLVNKASLIVTDCMDNAVESVRDVTGEYAHWSIQEVVFKDFDVTITPK